MTYHVDGQVTHISGDVVWVKMTPADRITEVVELVVDNARREFEVDNERREFVVDNTRREITGGW